MNKIDAKLLVSVNAKTAFLKISGRASCACSEDFKTLLNELRERSVQRFVLDLTDCTTMDSTFLGVLAGQATVADEARNGSGKHQLELLNPNPRVADLIDNLGVIHLFQIVEGDPIAQTGLDEVTLQSSSPLQLTKTCLEAHQKLMELNPNNVPKFKDVAAFLTEDLKKNSNPR